MQLKPNALNTLYIMKEHHFEMFLNMIFLYEASCNGCFA